MKEKDFINIIKDTLNSKHIGDDCAYLEDLGIVITQDSLVEDVHFKQEFTTPFKLGYKSAMVNISDVCASGAEPVYMTVALSLPQEISTDFIKEFYEGFKAAAKGVEIVGGDITGSDKIFISITAIGKTANRKISSRANAQIGQLVVVSGEHGNSFTGLKSLLGNKPTSEKFLNAHLMPQAQLDFSRQIAQNIEENYAMMDTSDGLMDALSQIANASRVKLSINYEKIPHDSSVDKNSVLFGGEDYQLIATVPQNLLPKLNNYYIIGTVEQGLGVELNGELFLAKDVDKKIYHHFKMD